MPRFLFVAHAMARLEGEWEEEEFAMEHTYHYNGTTTMSVSAV